MKKIATPHFDFESKKEYMIPEMEVIELKSKHPLMVGSPLGSAVYDEEANDSYNEGYGL